MVTAMAAVGEQTGNLDDVLLRAADALERRRTLMVNLRTALIYPSVVVIMAVATVAYMMVGLIPKLSKFLAGMGRRLPSLTQALVDLSSTLRTHALDVLVVIGGLGAAFLAFRAWPPGRRAIDGLLLRLPVAGTVLRLAGTATVARNLGSLLASGVRITEALATLEPLLKNRVLAGRVARARERVLQGSSLSEPLSQPGGFLPMLGHMVAVGESSGTLDDVLEQVAQFHEQRLESVVRRLSAIVEPAVIVVVGGMVGFVYMAFFVALYSIAGGRS
jgi:type IV pilus assembly protein PilC